VSRTIGNPEGTDKVAGEFDSEQHCDRVRPKMVKLIPVVGQECQRAWKICGKERLSFSSENRYFIDFITSYVLID
jgi:hypothetical protein